MNFEDLNLDRRLLVSVKAAGYTKPTPIQEQAIPVALKGHDVLGLAQTGTGKTAGFMLPILQRLITGPLDRYALSSSLQPASLRNRSIRRPSLWGNIPGLPASPSMAA